MSARPLTGRLIVNLKLRIGVGLKVLILGEAEGTAESVERDF
jgi:hypothetical protein